MTARASCLSALAPIIVALLSPSGALGQEDSCTVPNHVMINGVALEAVSEPVKLETKDFPTKLRWIAGIVARNLARDEIGVHLYGQDELDGFEMSSVEWDIPVFIVCRSDTEESYWARLANARRDAEDAAINYLSNNDILFGSAVPLVIRHPPTGEREIVRADLELWANLRSFRREADSPMP